MIPRTAEVFRLLRTVRHLRFSQMIHRSRRWVERRLTSLSRRRTTSRRGYRDGAYVDEFPFIPLVDRSTVDAGLLIEQLEHGVFHHLNQSRQIGFQTPDWHLGEPTSDRLWTATLHDHRWSYDLAGVTRLGNKLAERAEQLLVHYLSDWLRRCDVSLPDARPLAWNSHTVATRITWWIRCLCCLSQDFRQRNDRLVQQLLSSLWHHAEYLERHLEWDLRANHLLRNAVGLAWASRLFLRQDTGAGTSRVTRQSPTRSWSGRLGQVFLSHPPQRWLRKAMRLARRQAREQVLPDGGHFERSPMYHLEVMSDWLALALLLEEPRDVAMLRDTWQRMAGYIAWLRHPDGTLPQLNDAANVRADDSLALGPALGVEFDLSSRRGGAAFCRFRCGGLAWPAVECDF